MFINLLGFEFVLYLSTHVSSYILYIYICVSSCYWHNHRARILKRGLHISFVLNLRPTIWKRVQNYAHSPMSEVQISNLKRLFIYFPHVACWHCILYKNVAVYLFFKGPEDQLTEIKVNKLIKLSFYCLHNSLTLLRHECLMQY